MNGFLIWSNRFSTRMAKITRFPFSLLKWRIELVGCPLAHIANFEWAMPHACQYVLNWIELFLSAVGPWFLVGFEFCVLPALQNDLEIFLPYLPPSSDHKPLILFKHLSNCWKSAVKMTGPEAPLQETGEFSEDFICSMLTGLFRMFPFYRSQFGWCTFSSRSLHSFA